MRNRLLTILGLGIVGTSVAWAILRLTRDCREVVPDCWGNPLFDCPSPEVVCTSRPELFFVWLLPFVLVAIYWFAPQLRRLYEEHRMIFIAVAVALVALAVWPFIMPQDRDSDIVCTEAPCDNYDSGRTLLGPD